MSSPASSEVTGPPRLEVSFRAVQPTDIDECFALEQMSYPDDEAATKTTLQFRQHHAARYFRCAVLAVGSAEDLAGETAATDGADAALEPAALGGAAPAEPSAPPPGPAADVAETPSHSENIHAEDDDTEERIIGFVCATLCRAFDAGSMQTHIPSAPYLAIHSVVVHPEYRRRGIATRMLLDYVRFIEDSNGARATPIEKFVLLAKREYLTFYLHCGFSVVGPSPIQHGRELWYHLERPLPRPPQQTGMPCYVVNAFAIPRQSASGNPAAVVVLPPPEGGFDVAGGREEAWMQSVAAQFNLSETAFVQRRPAPEGAAPSSEGAAAEVLFEIRYFTPTCQIALCGHATLAAAAVLYQTVLNNDHSLAIEFHTVVPTTVLRAEYAAGAAATPPADTGDGSPDAGQQQRQVGIKMRFPTKQALEIEDEDSRNDIAKMLETALDIVDTGSGDSSILYMGFSDLGDVVVELTYESFIQMPNGGTGGNDSIDYNGFLIYDGYTRGVIVCCEAPPPKYGEEEETPMTASVAAMSIHDTTGTVDVRHVNFYSRFFAPKAGIPEDPVTGSAHATLAPYFAKKLGKDKVKGLQMSKRGGIVDCQLLDGESIVELTGLAVTVMSGKLFM